LKNIEIGAYFSGNFAVASGSGKDTFCDRNRDATAGCAIAKPGRFQFSIPWVIIY
jgi:hypothetical protein